MAQRASGGASARPEQECTDSVVAYEGHGEQSVIRGRTRFARWKPRRRGRFSTLAWIARWVLAMLRRMPNGIEARIARRRVLEEKSRPGSAGVRRLSPDKVGNMKPGRSPTDTDPVSSVEVV